MSPVYTGERTSVTVGDAGCCCIETRDGGALLRGSHGWLTEAHRLMQRRASRLWYSRTLGGLPPPLPLLPARSGTPAPPPSGITSASVLMCLAQPTPRLPPA